MLAASATILVSGCFNPSTPIDWVMNLPLNDRHDDLRAEYGVPTLVVLQHGLWRSWASLDRLQRSLEMHGYRVLNESYPSTSARIEEHAALLEEHIEERLRGRDEPMPHWLLLTGDNFIRTWVRSRVFYMLSKVSNVPVIKADDPEACICN